jgi:hypothetical protein
MNDSMTAGTWRVVGRGEDGLLAALGIVSIASDGRLEVLGAEPDEAEDLQDVVDELNGKAFIGVEVAPGDDEPDHAIVKRAVTRDDPAFLDALAGYLERYYDIHFEALDENAMPLEALPTRPAGADVYGHIEPSPPRPSEYEDD